MNARDGRLDGYSKEALVDPDKWQSVISLASATSMDVEWKKAVERICEEGQEAAAHASKKLMSNK